MEYMASKSNKGYNCALYCRLSRDDKNGNSESMSIQSQRDMLTAYAEEKGYNIVGAYVDDGYTGTNFDRPNWKRMIEDIEKGKINMVITKDLSRLGRNYVITGQYTDFYFPEHGVRYIAITDGYDSHHEDNDIAPFKNILNEMYAKDISKKVRSARKVAAKQGKFMGSKPPYGYLRSATDRHRLVIDDNVAYIIRRIFAMFADGDSARNIGSILNREKVDTPNEYYFKQIGRSNPYPTKKAAWGSATVMSILRSQVYIGNIVQGKQKTASHKLKKRIRIDEKDWVIAEDMHEALIDSDTWNRVQERIGANKPVRVRINSKSEVSLFSGLVRCADCGGLMAYNVKTSHGKKYYVYRCTTYANNGSDTCTVHTTHESMLEEIILNDIKAYSKLVFSDESTLIDRLMKANATHQQKSAGVLKNQIADTRKKIIYIDNLLMNLFEKNVNGDVSDLIFKNMSAKYEAEQSELRVKLERLEFDLSECESNANDVDKWVSRIKDCINIETLNRGILVELIDSITVSETYKIDNERWQDVTIKYKFVGALDDKRICS